MELLSFTVYAHPEPQGSARAFVRNGRASITSDNKKLKGYRQSITEQALKASDGVMLAPKHVPVRLELDFYFRKPDSAPRRRAHMVVKIDIDKAARGVCDALSGALYHDDAQVVELIARKHYGVPERVEIKMAVVGASASGVTR